MSLIGRPGEENGRLGSLKPDHESVRDVPDYLILLSAEYFRPAEGLLGAAAFQLPGRYVSLGLSMQDFREPSDLNGVGVAITLLVLGLVFAIAVAGFI